MISICKKVIVVILIPLILMGCWDSLDVNRRTITFSSGVDKFNDYIELSGEAAKIQANTLGNSETTKAVEIFIYDAFGKTLEEARGDFNNKVTAPNFAGTIRAIVIGKKYASNGIESYVNRTYFIPELRSSVLTVICKEPIKEFFSKKVENDASIGYAIENTIKTLSDNGATIYKTIQGIQSDMMFGDIGYLMPYVENNHKSIKYLGLAVMKDSKMIGTINTKESRGYLYLLAKNLSYSSSLNLSDKKDAFSIRTILKKRKIKTSYEDEKINIYIDLNFGLQLDYQNKIEPLNKDDFREIEEAMAKKIEDEIISSVKVSQEYFKCDVFGFARYFKAKNPREYKKINWKEDYPKAVVHVNVETTFTKTNLINPYAIRIK